MCLFVHNGSTQNVGWLYRRKKESEAWSCVALSWAVCLYCRAGSHWSWEPGVGANQYKKLLLCFLLTCVSQRGELKGRKRRRLWKNAFFNLLWRWVMNQPGCICVIIAGTGEHQKSYSPVTVSDSGIHLTRHQHLHLNCSFPVVGEKNFPSICHKTRLGNWQLRWVCLQ